MDVALRVLAADMDSIGWLYMYCCSWVIHVYVRPGCSFSKNLTLILQHIIWFYEYDIAATFPSNVPGRNSEDPTAPMALAMALAAPFCS